MKAASRASAMGVRGCRSGRSVGSTRASTTMSSSSTTSLSFAFLAIRFYRGTFALQEALYGIEHDDREAFERGIAGYR